MLYVSHFNPNVLERIANDVLSLSRIQLQVLSIYPVEFELIPEVRRIVAIFTNELKMYVEENCLLIYSLPKFNLLW